MQENINIPDSTITSALTFRNLVLMNMQQLTNFPYIEQDFDALTDYELLCLVVKYLNDVIDNQNEQNDSITNMYNAFLALQTYVNNTKDTLEDAFNNLDDYVRNYFDNLDVQDEINNKLDEMLEDGILEQIIEQFLQIKSLLCFDNVAEMKLSTNITNGSYAKTLGYYAVNDGGSSLYKIRTITNNDVVDEGSIIELADDSLIAELVVENNEVNVNQFGAKGDNVTDDTQAIQNAINYAGTKGFKDVKLINYRYYCESGLEITYSEFKLHGQPLTEYANGIRFSDSVSVGIDVKSYGFRMDNLFLSTSGLEHSDNVIGLRLLRPIGTGTSEEIETAMNLDADITSCSFFWLETGILAKGRNVNIDGCEFTECKNGFELAILSTGHSHRDIWIRNNRFHGIGAYQRDTIGYTVGIAIKFPSEWVRTDTYGNIIRNNFFDYCNNIFTGCILGSTISDNNILDCLHDGIVAINPNDTTINSNNNIEVLISNNNINLRGNASNYGIYLKGVGRPRITGNIVANQPTIAVLLEKCSTIWFTNNNLNCIRSDITENLKIIGSSGDEVFLADNMFSSFQNANNTYVNISGVSKIYTGGNVETGSSTAIVTNVTPLKQGEDPHFW